MIGGAQGGAQGGASGGGRAMFSGHEATSTWFEEKKKTKTVIIVISILSREEEKAKESIYIIQEPFVVSVE